MFFDVFPAKKGPTKYPKMAAKKPSTHFCLRYWLSKHQLAYPTNAARMTRIARSNLADSERESTQRSSADYRASCQSRIPDVGHFDGAQAALPCFLHARWHLDNYPGKRWRKSGRLHPVPMCTKVAR